MMKHRSVTYLFFDRLVLRYNVAVIIAIVAVFAVAFLVDSLRRSSGRKRSSPGAGQNDAKILTANEALPTQTGRFRAKQALEAVEKDRQERTKVKTEDVAEDSAITSDEDDVPLPDPFDSNNK